MKAMLLRVFLILLLLVLGYPSLSPAAQEQRIALVIGNSAYSSGPLKNPVNDATDMATHLQKLGFTVTLKKNANLETMEGAIEDFGNRLKRGGVGLFYYAGHGVQVNGVNYLIPIGAKVNKESDVRYKAVDAGRILDEMANANNVMNIVLLDACRDNPFGKSFRSASRGLAIVSNSPSGTFISYSTSPGHVASDGEGRNSPYTRALLENIGKPGLSINKVFMNVRSKVKRDTGQVPWELSSLEGDFYFVSGSSKTATAEDESSLLTTATTNELARQKEALERERQELARAKQEIARQKAIDVEREQLAAERRKLEAERQQLAMVRPTVDRSAVIKGTWKRDNGNRLYQITEDQSESNQYIGKCIQGDPPWMDLRQLKFRYDAGNKFVGTSLWKESSGFKEGFLSLRIIDENNIEYITKSPDNGQTLTEIWTRVK